MKPESVWVACILFSLGVFVFITSKEFITPKPSQTPENVGTLTIYAEPNETGRVFISGGTDRFVYVSKDGNVYPISKEEACR